MSLAWLLLVNTAHAPWDNRAQQTILGSHEDNLHFHHHIEEDTHHKATSHPAPFIRNTCVKSYVYQSDYKMNPDTKRPLCPDWVVVSSSNVHVANDRAWFKTYTPFKSRVDVSSSLDIMPIFCPVLGIGSVEIPTIRSPDGSGASSHGTILLREVLHAPESIYNFLGQPLFSTDGYSLAFGSDNPKALGTIKDRQGKDVAYLDAEHPKWTPKVRCAPDGFTLGPYVFQKGDGAPVFLGGHWDEAEERRWQKFKARKEQPIETTTADKQLGEPQSPNISPLINTTKIPSRNAPSGSNAKDREQPTSGRQQRDHLLLPKPAFSHKKKRRAPQHRQSAHRQDATSHKAEETTAPKKTYVLEILIAITGISVAWWTMSGVRA